MDDCAIVHEMNIDPLWINGLQTIGYLFTCWP